MRLIDADSLEVHEFYNGEWVDGVYKDDIDSAPTIEERKTGRWNGTQNVECDQCGHLYPAFMRLEKYCPNCGSYNGGRA